jgi:signal transduction histidine kinase
MAAPASRIYAGHMARPGDVELQYSAMLQRIGISGCAAISVLVTLGVIHGMTGQSPAVIAGATVALVVALSAMGYAVMRASGTGASLTALTTAGIAGVVLIGLIPEASGYLVVFVALIGIGMELPLALALPAGLAVFAAANLALLLAARLSLTNVISNDIGAVFLFTVGVFARSMRVSQARARADQARAEDLLARLQASQAAQAEAATLTERTRLAREIHDILAHSLAGLVLALDTAELLGKRGQASRDESDSETVAKILGQVTRAQRIAREGLADTRRAVSALRGDELPGPALLDRLVKDTSEATGIHAALTVAGEQRALSPEVGLALYRTAQEALINTAKYAGRDGRAELRVTYGAGDVELAIDDARSADAAPPGPAGLTFGGYGLTGMRERAELLGGKLTAGPTDEGFRVLLWLPTAPEPEAL